ncbi:MAG: hypothetical protein O2877_00785 [bacterium]|nr:hypothetical protein [bacterium]
MSNTPQYDAKIKTILDALQPGERTCELTGEKWMMDEEEIGWYKKFNVPPHPWSPLTRMKHLVGFWEVYQFWYVQHPGTGKRFLSATHPSTGIPVLPDEEWFDKDFSTLNQEVDLQQSIFDQIRTLELRVPFPALRSIKKPENSIAVMSCGDVNSYFVMACRSKNSFYSTDVMDLEDSAEVSAGSAIQGSYHILQSHRIFNCRFLHGCYDCLNSMFLFDCRNCENCFGATNKRNKKYLWMNEQLSKEEWEKRFAEVDMRRRSQIETYKQDFSELMRKEAIWPENFNEKCTNVLGEYMVNAVDCKYVFAGVEGPYRNLYHVVYLSGHAEDSAFTAGLYGSSLAYLSQSVVDCNDVKFCWSCVRCQRMEYSIFCYDCEDCFGCIGLRRKRFCIFNKQYTEDDYWKKVDEIKCAMFERGECGQFFPAKLFLGYWPEGGLVLYNAQDEASIYDPLVFDPEGDGAMGSITERTGVDASTVPDDIDDMTDEAWTNVAVFDKEFGRRFAYLKPELDWYRKQKLGAPREHFIKRVYDLLLEQNLMMFEKKSCEACGASITVAQSVSYPDRKIYCKSCYLKYLEQYG